MYLITTPSLSNSPQVISPTARVYFIFPNKRGFRGPRDVDKRVDSLTRPKSVRGNWPCCIPLLPRASHGLPPTTGRTIFIVPMFQIRHREQNENIKVFRQRFWTPTVKSRRRNFSTDQKLSSELGFSPQRAT